MTVMAIKSRAEQQLIAQFDQVADKLPGRGKIADARRSAIGAFAARGLPHRRIEAWKYTDLRQLTKDAYPVASEGGAVTVSPAALDAALGAGLAKLDCIRMVFVDGAFVPGLSSVGGPGCEIVPLATVLGEPGHDWIEATMFRNEGESADDMLLALNAAFATDGAIARIDSSKTGKLVHLIFVGASASPHAAATRNMIRVENGLPMTILESHVGLPGAARQSNSVTQIHICQGAQVQHLKLLAEGGDAAHLATWLVDIEAGASYSAFQMTESIALARHQHFITFKGEGAHFHFNAAVLGRGPSHIDTTLVIDHAVPGCTSRETVKAVLDGAAHGVFQGRVIVRPDAQKSDGKQMAKALLLSPDAEFDSKPELEIYADDVVCGHGSTVSELDDDQVFYLRARGIPDGEARALLIEAFVAETLDGIANEPIRDAMRIRLQAWLANSEGAQS